MNKRGALNRVSAVAIALGCVPACRDDAPAVPRPAVDPAPLAEAVAVDAGEAGVDTVTSSALDDEPSSSAVADAAPDAAPARPQPPSPNPVVDAGLQRKRAVDAGDAGDRGKRDAGAAPETRECSSLDSEGPSELGLCADRHEDWCSSEAVVAACQAHAVSRDEGVFAAYLDCLDEAFSDPDLCDGDEGARLAAAATCAESADEVACIEHASVCEVYDGCEGYTVAECDANVARFNSQYLRYGAPYFECPTPPSVALGE